MNVVNYSQRLYTFAINRAASTARYDTLKFPKGQHVKVDKSDFERLEKIPLFQKAVELRHLVVEQFADTTKTAAKAKPDAKAKVDTDK